MTIFCKSLSNIEVSNANNEQKKATKKALENYFYGKQKKAVNKKIL